MIAVIRSAEAYLHYLLVFIQFYSSRWLFMQSCNVASMDQELNFVLSFSFFSHPILVYVVLIIETSRMVGVL